MEVTCRNCSTKMNIPDEKIPGDRAVRIACPKCKSKITLHPKNAPRGYQFIVYERIQPPANPKTT